MATTHKCKHCGKRLSASQVKNRSVYCSGSCAGKHRTAMAIAAVDKAGEFPVRYGGEASRRFVRTYLESKHGHVCSICGRSDWDGTPIPLVVDHIDGNAFNSKVSNFRLVCGNCNLLLDTYGSRNRYGRKWWSRIKERCH